MPWHVPAVLQNNPFHLFSKLFGVIFAATFFKQVNNKSVRINGS